VTFQQYAHAMLPEANQDELARQLFAKTMREFCTGELQPGNAVVYERSVKAQNPKTRIQVRRAMERTPFHQMWSALMRTTQEMVWGSVQDSVDRQIDTLLEKAKVNARGKGSLRLDASVKAPRYVTAVDIHCMPGNYHTEYEAGDVYQAALYDRGAYLYAMGSRGPMHDSGGRDIVAYADEHHPRFRPSKILDMGCTVGASTVPICDAFPEAEVHAIDVAAPPLRYGHARAESLGRAIHFSQQNAEHTTFDDDSFDLIFSCILMHETSNKALRNYVRESHRLLKPGGVALHMDFPHNADKSPFEQYMVDWNTHHNAEPFVGTLGDLDLAEVAVGAGFRRDDVAVRPVASLRRQGGRPCICWTRERRPKARLSNIGK
jgi:ubiquinone/menaquinone biosynthesis C-methylase UbiE